MSYAMTLGDTLELDELNEALAEMDRQLVAFNAGWDSTIGTTVPPQFVLDIVQTLLDNVITPFTNLRLEAASAVENIEVTQQIREAGSAGDVIWQDRILPVLFAALEQKRANAPTMEMPADMKQRVIAVLQFYRTGYQQVRDAIRARSWWAKLGAVSELAIEFMVTASKAFIRVKEWIKAGAGAVYNTVVGIGNILDAIVKVSMVGGAGLLAYWLFFGKKNNPRRNPSRRRRRRPPRRADGRRR